MGLEDRRTRLKRALMLPLLTAGALVWLVASSPDVVNRRWWGKVVKRARTAIHVFRVPPGAPVFLGDHAGFHRTLTCIRFLGERANGEFEELWLSFPNCAPPRVRLRESAERVFVHRTVVPDWDLVDSDPEHVLRGLRRYRKRRGIRRLSEWACQDHLARTGESLEAIWVLQRVDRQHFDTEERQTLVHAIHHYDCGTHKSLRQPWPEVELNAEGVPEFR
jgi:hypothetical protein